MSKYTDEDIRDLIRRVGDLISQLVLLVKEERERRQKKDRE